MQEGQGNKKKSGKKVLIVTGVMLALFMVGSVVGNNSNMFGMTTYVAEQSQGYNWSQEADVWKVKDGLGNYVINDWFKNSTGSWYFMGADGVMLDGIINDNGHYYFL